MTKAKTETKILMEKTYIIPLRKEISKVPRYKRAKKAISSVRNFLARHMKIYDNDLKKIKIDGWINKAIWVRGIKSPPQKITLKAIKYSDGIVKTEFISLPPKFREEDKKLKKKIAKAKEERLKAEEKKSKKTEEEKKEVKEEKKTEEEIKEEKEKKEKEKALHKETLKPAQELMHKIKAEKRDKKPLARKALEK